MAHAVVIRCPNCSATLKVDPTADTATCTYCGATALVRKEREAAPPSAPGSKLPLLAVAGIGAAAVLAGVGFFLTIKSSPTRRTQMSAPAPRPAPPSQVEAPPPPPPPPVVPAPQPASPLGTEREPIVVDVDGDGDPDVVALAGDAYLLFDVESGAQLGRIEAGEQPMAAVAHGRLLVHSGKGQVSGYALPSGESQWTTALGDQGLAFCASRQPDTVEIMTADDRVLALDVKTGRQSPARATGRCAPLPTDERRLRLDPRDRADRRAPAGVTAWRCGTVTVMGSENYTVPDACKARAHVDPDAYEGLALHAVWQAGGGWFAFGVRDPGTHSPVVALLKGGRLVWKADVAEGNPLDAEGGPSPIALAGDRAIAGYRTRAGAFLTAFSLADGKRLWRVALEDPSDRIAVAGDRLLLYARGRITVLDATTGAKLRVLGG